MAFVAGMVARAPRRKVSIPARMRTGSAPVSVRIRDISPRSMLLEGETAPPPGTYVEIIGPESSIAGQVIWSRDGRFGVRTRERLDVKATTTELRSLQPPTDDPAATRPKSAPTGNKGSDLEHRAERSRFAGRRLEHAAIATCAALAALAVAATAYHTISRAMAPVATGLHGAR